MKHGVQPWYAVLVLNFTSVVDHSYQYGCRDEYRRDQRRCEKRSSGNYDPQNIWNPRENCGSFVNATSSESYSK